jgi:hypothetical protein
MYNLYEWNSEGVNYRQTVHIIYLILATCFDSIRSSSGQQYKIHKKYSIYKVYIFFSNGATAPSGPGPPHYRGFTITLRHTTLGTNPLNG